MILIDHLLILPRINSNVLRPALHLLIDYLWGHRLLTWSWTISLSLLTPHLVLNLLLLYRGLGIRGQIGELLIPVENLLLLKALVHLWLRNELLVIFLGLDWT